MPREQGKKKPKGQHNVLPNTIVEAIQKRWGIKRPLTQKSSNVAKKPKVNDALPNSTSLTPSFLSKDIKKSEKIKRNENKFLSFSQPTLSINTTKRCWQPPVKVATTANSSSEQLKCNKKDRHSIGIFQLKPATEVKDAEFTQSMPENFTEQPICNESARKADIEASKKQSIIESETLENLSQDIMNDDLPKMIMNNQTNVSHQEDVYSSQCTTIPKKKVDFTLVEGPTAQIGTPTLQITPNESEQNKQRESSETVHLVQEIKVETPILEEGYKEALTQKIPANNFTSSLDNVSNSETGHFDKSVLPKKTAEIIEIQMTQGSSQKYVLNGSQGKESDPVHQVMKDGLMCDSMLEENRIFNTNLNSQKFPSAKEKQNTYVEKESDKDEIFEIKYSQSMTGLPNKEKLMDTKEECNNFNEKHNLDTENTDFNQKVSSFHSLKVFCNSEEQNKNYSDLTENKKSQNEHQVMKSIYTSPIRPTDCDGKSKPSETCPSENENKVDVSIASNSENYIMPKNIFSLTKAFLPSENSEIQNSENKNILPINSTQNSETGVSNNTDEISTKTTLSNGENNSKTTMEPERQIPESQKMSQQSEIRTNDLNAFSPNASTKPEKSYEEKNTNMKETIPLNKKEKGIPGKSRWSPEQFSIQTEDLEFVENKSMVFADVRSQNISSIPVSEENKKEVGKIQLSPNRTNSLNMVGKEKIKETMPVRQDTSSSNDSIKSSNITQNNKNETIAQVCVTTLPADQNKITLVLPPTHETVKKHKDDMETINTSNISQTAPMESQKILAKSELLSSVNEKSLISIKQNEDPPPCEISEAKTSESYSDSCAPMLPIKPTEDHGENPPLSDNRMERRDNFRQPLTVEDAFFHKPLAPIKQIKSGNEKETIYSKSTSTITAERKEGGETCTLMKLPTKSTYIPHVNASLPNNSREERGNLFRSPLIAEEAPEIPGEAWGEDMGLTSSQLLRIESECEGQLMVNTLPQGWKQKMDDNRNKLRKVITEIKRLNALLTQVRREFWRSQQPIAGTSQNQTSRRNPTK